MRTKLFILLLLVSILISGCATATTQAPSNDVPPTAQIIRETAVPQTHQTIIQTVVSEVVVTPTPGPNLEAVIQNVEPRCHDHLLDFLAFANLR